MCLLESKIGRVICPDGSTVYNKKIKGSVPYSLLLQSVENEKYSERYRTKIIKIIAEVGVFDVKFVNYIQKLLPTINDNAMKIAADKIIEIFYRNKP